MGVFLVPFARVAVVPSDFLPWQGVEGTIVVALCAAIALYYYLMPTPPESYIAIQHAPFLHTAAAAAPFLIYMSPTGHHYIVALETAMPVASFIALILLYGLSPVEPYMDCLKDMKGIVPMFLIVPICFPILIICIMHAFRRGFTLVLSCVMLAWMNVFLMLGDIPAGHAAMLWTMVALASATNIALGCLLYYRQKHISSHVIYGSQPIVPARKEEDDSFTIGEASEHDLHET